MDLTGSEDHLLAEAYEHSKKILFFGTFLSGYQLVIAVLHAVSCIYVYITFSEIRLILDNFRDNSI